MKVIPVIDILHSVAVHAVRGRRSAYQPLQSTLVSSADPLAVAAAFKTLGFSELYVADLDAIMAGTFNFDLFGRIIGSTGLSLMVDAGITSFEWAEWLLGCGVSKFVIGTESLLAKGFVGEAVERLGGDHVVVSLDLKNGRVLGKLGDEGLVDPLQLLGEFEMMGVLEVIVLDLARVGSGEGVDTDFLGRVINKTNLLVYAGGGVRNIADLVELCDMGVGGALVATALHTGGISVSDLKQTGFF